MSNYFPHDSNARSDEKLIALRIKHQWSGYGLYWALIEKLRDTTCYTLKADYNVIAYDLRAEASVIKSIINDFGLFAFTDNGECFYSESLLNRMKPLDDRKEKLSESGKKGNDKRWKKDSHPIATQSPPDSHPIASSSQDKIREDKIREDNNTEDKEIPSNEGTKKTLAAAKAATLSRKQKFGESLIPFTEQYGNVMIREFFDYWSELNKQETKMRVDKQDTWELPKRLATWAKKEKFDGKTTNGVSKQGTYSGGRAQDKAASRQSLEDLADAVLGQIASEECT